MHHSSKWRSMRSIALNRCPGARWLRCITKCTAKFRATRDAGDAPYPLDCCATSPSPMGLWRSCTTRFALATDNLPGHGLFLGSVLSNSWIFWLRRATSRLQ